MIRTLLEDLVHTREVVGEGGRLFTQYKLRTMDYDAEEKLDVAAGNGRDGLGKPVNDHRAIPGLQCLRRYWIDELPQLVNIARGEMALVGIRPRSEREWRDLPPEQMNRATRYKPGLMGIPYACSHLHDFSDLVAAHDAYLDWKEVAPILTDVIYFITICYNILVKGERGK